VRLCEVRHAKFSVHTFNLRSHKHELLEPLFFTYYYYFTGLPFFCLMYVCVFSLSNIVYRYLYYWLLVHSLIFLWQPSQVTLEDYICRHILFQIRFLSSSSCSNKGSISTLMQLVEETFIQGTVLCYKLTWLLKVVGSHLTLYVT